MANETEAKVSKFFNSIGWQTEGGVTEEARRWEDLREHAQAYVSRCRLRILRHIPERGDNFLDVGSGPIQFPEYLAYSANFKKRYCVDLSTRALDDAKAKIGDHGVFLPGSIIDMPLEDNFFDCTISLKALFNIDKDRQEEVVRKLIRVTKPGKPIIISYANPRPIYPHRLFRRKSKLRSAAKDPTGIRPGAPLGSHYRVFPTDWWGRFNDVATVNILPWHSFPAEVQKILIPNNKLGGKLFDLLFYLEDRFPEFFVKCFHGLLVVLIKR